jgi:hypothetical protein
MLRILLHLIGCLLRRPPAPRPTSYLALASMPMAPAPDPERPQINPQHLLRNLREPFAQALAIAHLKRCWGLQAPITPHHHEP